MGDVLAARSDDFSTADSVVQALFAAGVPIEAVSVFSRLIPLRVPPRRMAEDDVLDSRRLVLASVVALASMGAIFGVALALTFKGSSLTMLVLGPLGASAGAWFAQPGCRASLGREARA